MAQISQEKKFTEVSEAEFNEFIKSYPNKLDEDYFMDWFTWNDFSDGKVYPDSIVAMFYNGLYNTPKVYKIRT